LGGEETDFGLVAAQLQFPFFPMKKLPSKELDDGFCEIGFFTELEEVWNLEFLVLKGAGTWKIKICFFPTISVVSRILELEAAVLLLLLLHSLWLEIGILLHIS
jgi:hypothetical protein